MMNTRDDAEFWKHGIIRTTNRMFRNTECIFVEYHDCIHLTGFIVLKAIQESCKDVLGIDIDQISVMDMRGLLLWYINRKHRNFLIDLWDKEKKIPYEILDEYLDAQFCADEIYQIPFGSIITDLILHTLDLGFVKNVVVYVENICDGIVSDVDRLFGDSARVVGGRLEDALSDIPQDTTYIFSDFEKVITLANLNKLEGASVLLPSNYKYNYILADNGELQPIINLEHLSKTNHFSLGFVDLSGY